MVDVTACNGKNCPLADRCVKTHYQRTYGHEWTERHTITAIAKPAYDPAVQRCPNFEKETEA